MSFIEKGVFVISSLYVQKFIQYVRFMDGSTLKKTAYNNDHEKINIVRLQPAWIQTSFASAQPHQDLCCSLLKACAAFIMSKRLLLDCSQPSGTELDYEYSLASESEKLELQATKSKTSEVRIGSDLPTASGTEQNVPLLLKEVLHPQQTTKDVGLQVQPRSNVKDINKSFDGSKISDVLDLQRMADKFARAEMGKLKGVEKIVYKTVGFNYEVVTRVDKLLEEAYNMLHTFQKKLDFTTRTKLLNLILTLNELPHLHNSTHREKGKSARVTDWLINHASRPEPELCGFTMQGPVQPNKFVTDMKPRVSSSDTNITIGKRKRGCEDSGKDDIISVQESSSDTRVYVHAAISRLGSNGKRRRLRND